MLDDMGDVEYCPVIGWYVGIVRKEKVPPGATASLGFTQVAGIAVGSQYHVAGIVREHCFFLGGNVVK